MLSHSAGPRVSCLPILISSANPRWPPLSDPAIWNSLTVLLHLINSGSFFTFYLSPLPVPLNIIPSKLVYLSFQPMNFKKYYALKS